MGASQPTATPEGVRLVAVCRPRADQTQPGGSVLPYRATLVGSAQVHTGGCVASLPLCNPRVKQAYAVEASALGISRRLTLSRRTLPPGTRAAGDGEMAGMPVFVLDAQKKPLTPCAPAVARKLLASGRAAVLRRYPFTIILKRGIELP